MASLELNKQSCPEHVLKWIENGGQIHYVTSLHRQSTASFNYQKVYENSSESRLVSFCFRDFVISILGTYIKSIFLYGTTLGTTQAGIHSPQGPGTDQSDLVIRDFSKFLVLFRSGPKRLKFFGPGPFAVNGFLDPSIIMIKPLIKPIGRLNEKELLRKMLNIVMRKFNRILKTLQNLKTAP